MLTQHFTSRLSLIRLAGIAAILAAALATALVNAAPALAAPYWCKAWQVAGQTWYASQSNGYTLVFTLRTPPGSTRFNGYARYNRGDVNLGGTSSRTHQEHGVERGRRPRRHQHRLAGRFERPVHRERHGCPANVFRQPHCRASRYDCRNQRRGRRSVLGGDGLDERNRNVGWPALLADVLFARERPALSRLVANDRTGATPRCGASAPAPGGAFVSRERGRDRFDGHAEPRPAVDVRAGVMSVTKK